MRYSTPTWRTRLIATIRRRQRARPPALAGIALVIVAAIGCTSCETEVSTVGIREHLGEVWQLTPPQELTTFRQAQAYCGQLALGGRDDWRLPSIDELRTLIVDCPGRELGGACRISEDDCLDKQCWEQRDCGHCNEKQGPADGCYWQPDTWEGSCTDGWFFWSDSAFNGLTDHLWVVRYQGGGLFDDGVVGFNEELGDGAVRCIAGKRDPPTAAPAPTPGGISLPEFCARATEACSTVTTAECAHIVVDADKLVRPGDIPCAASSSTCEDTQVCLDALPNRNAEGMYIHRDGPTTLPAGGEPTDGGPQDGGGR